MKVKVGNLDIGDKFTITLVGNDLNLKVHKQEGDYTSCRNDNGQSFNVSSWMEVDVPDPVEVVYVPEEI